MIVVDAGNTRIKFAWMDSALQGGLPLSRDFQAIAVGKPLPRESLLRWSAQEPHAIAIVAGSNPPEVARILREWPSALPAPRTIGDRKHLPIQIDVEFPERVGVDRLLNAIAANACRSHGQMAFVIDSGTATTVDLVGSTGVFLGGAILPGFEMGARALNHYTALLPLIPHHGLHDRTPRAVGRNTIEALESGLYWGHVGAVRQLIEQFRIEANRSDDQTEPLILLTGGAAPVLRPHLPQARWEAGLCLQGLALTAAKMPVTGAV